MPLTQDGNVVLDFVDEKGNDVSTDEDRMFVDLNGYSYKDPHREADTYRPLLV